MSIKLMSAIFDTEFRDLPMPEPDKDGKARVAKASSMKLVLLALADHANDEGESAYPGLTKLQRKTGLSRQGVIDVTSALKFNGLVFVDDIPSKLGTNSYTIWLGAYPKLAGLEEEKLLVKPLDQSSHFTNDSQVTLPEVVKPLDLKHTLNTKETSKDILDGIIHFEQKPQSIRQAVKEHFKLNVNWETKLNHQWMEWAVSENITPDQIKLAAERWRSEKAFNWQVPTLKGIFEKWQMLMDSGNSNLTEAPKVRIVK